MKNVFTLALILVSGTAFAHTLDSSFYFFEKGIEENYELLHPENKDAWILESDNQWNGEGAGRRNQKGKNKHCYNT